MDPVQQPLSFKPLTEGLGFHPFSDGLPYAPIAKTPSLGLASKKLDVSFPIVSKLSIKPAPTSLDLGPAERPSRDLIYVGRRFLAYVLDTLLNTLFASGVLAWFVWKQGFSLDVLVNFNVLVVTALTLVFINWFLIAFQEIFFFTTVGKKSFGLKFQGSSLRLLVRAMLFVPSFGLMGLGLLSSLFHSRKACWHDLSVGIQPLDIHE